MGAVRLVGAARPAYALARAHEPGSLWWPGGLAVLAVYFLGVGLTEKR
jgi:hypothetical protein